MLHTVLVQVLVDSVTIKHANEARAIVRQALDRDTQPELVGFTIIDAVAADAVGAVDVRYRKNPTPRHRVETISQWRCEVCSMVGGMHAPNCPVLAGR